MQSSSHPAQSAGQSDNETRRGSSSVARPRERPSTSGRPKTKKAKKRHYSQMQRLDVPDMDGDDFPCRVIRTRGAARESGNAGRNKNRNPGSSPWTNPTENWEEEVRAYQFPASVQIPSSSLNLTGLRLPELPRLPRLERDDDHVFYPGDDIGPGDDGNEPWSSDNGASVDEHNNESDPSSGYQTEDSELPDISDLRVQDDPSHSFSRSSRYFEERLSEQERVREMLPTLTTAFSISRYAPKSYRVSWPEGTNRILLIKGSHENRVQRCPFQQWNASAQGVSGQLLLRGYLPSRLLAPRMAFHMDCVEHYVSHFQESPVSKQAFCESLCTTNKLIYTESFRLAFSFAVDIYDHIQSGMRENLFRILFKGRSPCEPIVASSNSPSFPASAFPPASPILSVTPTAPASANSPMSVTSPTSLRSPSRPAASPTSPVLSSPISFASSPSPPPSPPPSPSPSPSLSPYPPPPSSSASPSPPSQPASPSRQGDSRPRPSMLAYRCPTCFMELENDRHDASTKACVALDGNNSLKRLATRSSGGRYQRHDSMFRLDPDWVHEHKLPGQASKIDKHCGAIFKAGKETTVRSNFFAETGWFPLVCRHGAVLQYADMIKEAESSKFPLALLRWLGDRWPHKIVAGYDIGCQFSKTFARSELLEGMIGRVEFRVPIFHAFAHDYPCQEHFNPFMNIGSGLTNFENCERLFSFTNKMAFVSRHTTEYHRHQQLEWMIESWNKKKLNGAGKRLIEMRKKAKDVQVESSGKLAALSHIKPQWTVSHFRSLARTKREQRAEFEESRDEHKKRLEALAEAYPLIERQVTANAAVLSTQVPPSVPNDVSGRSDYLATLEAYVAAFRAYVAAEEAIVTFKGTEQGKLIVDDFPAAGDYARWLASQDGLQAKSATLYNRYTDALEHLKSECFNRLLEADKTHQRSTNEKLRRKIQIAIRRRYGSLKPAWEKYVAAWKALPKTPFKPPRLPSNVQKLSEDLLIEEFAKVEDLVHFQGAEWTSVEARDGIRAVQLLDAATEELEMVELEAVRLKAWFNSISAHWTDALESLDLQESVKSILWPSDGTIPTPEEAWPYLILCWAQEDFSDLERRTRDTRSALEQFLFEPVLTPSLNLKTHLEIHWSKRVQRALYHVDGEDRLLNRELEQEWEDNPEADADAMDAQQGLSWTDALFEAVNQEVPESSGNP